MTAPARRRVALPTDGMLPRVGKIRLGTSVPYERNGETRYRPQKADHFVVAEDESGITSAAAAEAFAAAYGAEPRELHAMLAGVTPDDVMEGAWRLYGTGKLKRKCDGETCDERLAAGGWESKPCACAAANLPETHKNHCTLTYTIQLILPDVAGVGVWQLDTGSDISARNMATWLQMMHTLRGDLRMLEFDLRLVEAAVSPEGQATTVYVLNPQAREDTPRQMLAGAPSTTIAALPAPAADETPERTLDRGGFDPETPHPAPATASASTPEGATGHAPPPTGAAPGGDDDDYLLGILRDNVTAQIAFLAPALKTRLKAVCEHYGVTPSRDGLIAAWGNRAENLEQLVADLESDMNAELQGELPIEDAEVVN